MQMRTQQKLELAEKTCTMAERLRAAAKRISQCENGVVEGSTRVLQEAQVGVYTDFAAFLVGAGNCQLDDPVQPVDHALNAAAARAVDDGVAGRREHVAGGDDV